MTGPRGPKKEEKVPTEIHREEESVEPDGDA